MTVLERTSCVSCSMHATTHVTAAQPSGQRPGQVRESSAAQQKFIRLWGISLQVWRRDVGPVLHSAPLQRWTHVAARKSIASTAEDCCKATRRFCVPRQDCRPRGCPLPAGLRDKQLQKITEDNIQYTVLHAVTALLVPAPGHCLLAQHSLWMLM
jgi:hypothetical protein